MPRTFTSAAEQMKMHTNFDNQINNLWTKFETIKLILEFWVSAPESEYNLIIVIIGDSA